MGKLLLGGIPIEKIGENCSVKSFKFLGMLVDEKLNWKYHINMLRGKLASSNFALNNTKNKLTFSARLKVFYSLIISHINYCAIIYSNTKCNELKLLDSLHKKAIRHLTLSKYNAHTSILYKKHNILSFQDTIFMQKALFMHNYRNDRLPISFQNQFIYKTDVDSQRLRHDEGTFVITNNRSLSPLQSAAHSWNNIPYSIRNISKTNLFKKSLKTYLINKYDDFCVNDNCYVCT